MMPLMLCLISTLSILSCFMLMTETCRKGGWVRRSKFIYLWALLLLPLAHLLEMAYLCQLFRFLTILGAFIIICHIPYEKITHIKKACLLCLYGGLFVQILTLLGGQISSLLS